MSRYTRAALRDEVARLAEDLATLTPDLVGQLEHLRRPQWTVLAGSGDSLFAAEAAAYAYAPGACLVRSTYQLRDYGLPGLPPALVAGISASGGNGGLAEGLARAAAAGHTTVAIVGDADSPVGRAAEHVGVAALPDRPPSPGVRSYQASLQALLLLTGLDPAAGLPGLVARTVADQADPCHELAARLTGTPVVQVLGGGPSAGTARYAAAKLVETAGVAALGQDVEEWWHVERLATVRNTPLIVLAPPGPSSEVTWRICARAKERGHPLAVLAQPDSPVARDHADLVLPLPAVLPAGWTPILEHVFAAPLAVRLAELLSREPFHRR